MHPHEPGNHGAVVHIEHLRVTGDFGLGSCAQRFDFPFAENDCLILEWGGTGSVDHPYVSQSDRRRIDFHKAPHFR